MKDRIDPWGGLDPQSGHQPRGPRLDIFPFQTKILSHTGGVKFKPTFSKSMMIELTFTEGPSTQPS